MNELYNIFNEIEIINTDFKFEANERIDICFTAVPAKMYRGTELYNKGKHLIHDVNRFINVNLIDYNTKFKLTENQMNILNKRTKYNCFYERNSEPITIS